jgi:hypothetical protein
MNFTVDWPDDSLAALAAAYLQAPDRQAVTAAQAAIDRLLAMDPRGNSTAVNEGLYALEVRLLRVQYEISERDRIVTVVSVRLLV